VRIGAHVSAAGGPERAVRRASEIGAECLQIFVGSPQTWAQPRLALEDVTAFRAALVEADLHPLFVHAPYLANLASARPEVRSASRRALGHQLAWADRLGAVGVVVHVGSGGASARSAPPAGAQGADICEDAFDLAAAGLEAVLRGHAGRAALILENDAGSGRRIGRSFAELGQLIRALGGDERLLVCLDTAHALAAGYEIRTPGGLDEALTELDSHVGLRRLALVHANDSKVDLGANVDRHENVGRGKIGLVAFARILAHPALRELPFVLEVPGYDGEGPDRANVDVLRWLAGRPLRPRPPTADRPRPEPLPLGERETPSSASAEGGQDS